ncbi:ABC transporter ATP-binding protein [Aestuariibius sp. HNIBRBA575]|uniref:ABC transporter ATP-binding protein n=1 Tax=Aestuariibius sp. HNIBRBA575 TaxID=3233343 RepID=UPI0034A42FD5
MTNPTLTIRDLRKMRGKSEVLQGVDLNVAPGERVALLGHNGAGKSTLFKCVLGLTRISGGQVDIAGARPGSGAARRNIAFLPEAVSFHKALTGREQLNVFARLEKSEANIAQLLDRVGLADAMDRRIGTYSKGMRQRLGLAQMLLGRPKLALLDEPTSGLDPISRQDLYDIIDEMAGQGTAIVIASHALTEVEARTDRIAILRKGVKVADDTLSNLSIRAGLPIRLRFETQTNADQIAAQMGGTRINGASVEIKCPASEKMQHLRRIADLGDVICDLDVIPPRLDDLYHHYAKGDAQ